MMGPKLPCAFILASFSTYPSSSFFPSSYLVRTHITTATTISPLSLPFTYPRRSWHVFSSIQPPEYSDYYYDDDDNNNNNKRNDKPRDNKFKYENRNKNEPLPDRMGDEEISTVSDALQQWMAARVQNKVHFETVDSADEPYEIMFVCRDNKLASVAAEVVFTDLVKRRGYDRHIVCYSAGTDALVGDPAEPKLIDALTFKKGLGDQVSHHSACRLEMDDLESYDLIVCMDESVRSKVLFMSGKHEDSLEDKVRTLSSFCVEERLRGFQFRSGLQSYGRDSFNIMISAIVDSCSGLLAHVVDNLDKNEVEADD